jgi:hypothetical protein
LPETDQSIEESSPEVPQITELGDERFSRGMKMSDRLSRAPARKR